jgi:hypothetical protein
VTLNFHDPGEWAGLAGGLLLLRKKKKWCLRKTGYWLETPRVSLALLIRFSSDASLLLGTYLIDSAEKKSGRDDGKAINDILQHVLKETG